MALLPDSKGALAIMHYLAISFGVGAWIAINGVWVELPVLISNPIKSLPEGWNLPSYLVTISQIANIGPLIVALMQKFCPAKYHQNALIYSILAMGTISLLLLCFLWDVTAFIGGTEYSVGLFTLFFILAFVDCTSSLTFLPFMTRFQQVFLTTYFIGEGLSGFLPSIVALGQGASMSHCLNKSFVNETTNETYYKVITEYTEIRFSVDWFFSFLFIMMACSSSSFILLNHTRIARMFRQKDDSSEFSAENEAVDTSTSTELTSFKSGSSAPIGYIQGDGFETVDVNVHSTAELHPQDFTRKLLSANQYVYFYVTIFWITCISNGVMPSVISYFSLPYGQLPYHFAATLGAMANPVACLIALFLPVRSHFIVGIFTLTATGFASYLMVLAVQSPCPLLVNSAGGSALMVISQIVFVGATSYVKVSIGQIFRRRGHPKSLVWYGAITQLGSMVGALVMFPLVNVYYLFQTGDPCTTQCY